MRVSQQFQVHHYATKDKFVNKLNELKDLGDKKSEWIQITKEKADDYSFTLAKKTNAFVRFFQWIFGKDQTLRFGNVGFFMVKFLEVNKDHLEELDTKEMAEVQATLKNLRMHFVNNKVVSKDIRATLKPFETSKTDSKEVEKLLAEMKKHAQEIKDAKKDISEIVDEMKTSKLSEKQKEALQALEDKLQQQLKALDKKQQALVDSLDDASKKALQAEAVAAGKHQKTLGDLQRDLDQLSKDVETKKAALQKSFEDGASAKQKDALQALDDKYQQQLKDLGANQQSLLDSLDDASKKALQAEADAAGKHQKTLGDSISTRQKDALQALDDKYQQQLKDFDAKQKSLLADLAHETAEGLKALNQYSVLADKHVKALTELQTEINKLSHDLDDKRATLLKSLEDGTSAKQKEALDGLEDKYQQQLKALETKQQALVVAFDAHAKSAFEGHNTAFLGTLDTLSNTLAEEVKKGMTAVKTKAEESVAKLEQDFQAKLKKCLELMETTSSAVKENNESVERNKTAVLSEVNDAKHRMLKDLADAAAKAQEEIKKLVKDAQTKAPASGVALPGMTSDGVFVVPQSRARAPSVPRSSSVDTGMTPNPSAATGQSSSKPESKENLKLALPASGGPEVTKAPGTPIPLTPKGTRYIVPKPVEPLSLPTTTLPSTVQESPRSLYVPVNVAATFGITPQGYFMPGSPFNYMGAAGGMGRPPTPTQGRSVTPREFSLDGKPPSGDANPASKGTSGPPVEEVD